MVLAFIFKAVIQIKLLFAYGMKARVNVHYF